MTAHQTPALGDLRECQAFHVRIERHIELAEQAYARGPRSAVGKHLYAAFALNCALRRLEKAIWHTAITQLREAGVVVGQKKGLA